MNFVVYAEGTTEAGQGWRSLPSPGLPLESHQQGPLHELVRRSVVRSLSMDLSDVRFLSPLRRSDGAVPRGSDLLRQRTLVKLLTFAGQVPSPDVAVVLVDQDEDEARLTSLRVALRGLPIEPLTAVGVAVEEFEAWLVADHECVRTQLGPDSELLERPQDRARGEAKEYLSRVHSKSGVSMGLWELRREISRTADLGTIAERCSSFRDFEAALKAAGLRAREARRGR